MKIEKPLNYIIFISLIANLLISCSSNLQLGRMEFPIKTYTGSELPNEQAIIFQDANKIVSFIEVDEKDKDEKGNLYSEASSLLLSPGEHSIKLKIRYTGRVKDGGFYRTMELTSRGLISIDIKTEAMHTYQVNPGFYIANNNRYSLNPHLENQTMLERIELNNYYIARAQDYSFEYNFSNSTSNINYKINSPKPESWFVNRSRNAVNNSPLMFYKAKGLDINTHFTGILINFTKYKPEISDSKITEKWFRKFLDSSYFDNALTNDIYIKVNNLNKTTLDKKEYLVFNSRISYNVARRDGRSFDEATVYISKPDSSYNSICQVFVILNSNFGKYSVFKSISDEDQKTFIDVITSSKCTITAKKIAKPKNN